MAKRPYEISLWTYTDKFISVLVDSKSPTYNSAHTPRRRRNVDGTHTLTFSIPIRVLDLETGKMVDNTLWYSNLRKEKQLAPEKKIKLIFNKLETDALGAYTHEIHEFVIEKMTERRESFELVCDVEATGAAFKELGKLGLELLLNEEIVFLEEEETPGLQIEPTLGYWLSKVFPAKQSDETAVVWRSVINMSDNIGLAKNRVYERDQVVNWETVNDKLEPIHQTEPIEKKRFISIENSNKYNITQTLAETFQVFVRYRYVYGNRNLPFQITDKIVEFYDNLLQTSEYTVTYGNNELGLSREIDSTEVTTKVFVDNIESEYSDSGLISIADAKNNKILDNFILNFQYFEDTKQLSEQQAAAIPIYEKTIRELNLTIAEKASDLATMEYEKAILEADVASQENRESSANTNALDIADKIATFDKSLATHMIDEKKVPTSVLNEDGRLVLPLRRLGIVRSTLTLHRRDTLIATTAYDIITDNYGYATKILLKAGANAVAGETLLPSYQYDLYSLYISQLTMYEQIRDSAKERKNKLQVLLNNQTVEIEATRRALKKASDDKQAATLRFNNLMSPFLKEGHWAESSYSPSFQSFSQVPAVIRFDPFPLNGEDVATYRVGQEAKETYYHYLTLPTTFDWTSLEKAVVIEKYTQGDGTVITNQLIYGAQWKPQYIYPKAVDSKRYATAALLIQNNPDPSFAYYIESTGQVYHFTNSWVVLNPVRALVFEKTVDLTQALSGRTYSLSTGYVFSSANRFTGSPFTIARPRHFFTVGNLRGKQPIENVQTTSLRVMRGVTELKEFEDYYVLHVEGAKALTFKLNNNAMPAATSFTLDYKIDVSAAQLYRDAQEVAITSGRPKVSYTVSLAHVAESLTPTVVQDYNAGKILDIASIVRISDHELEMRGVKGIVTEIDENLELEEDVNFTIQNYKTRFEDLFQRLVASSEQLQASGYLYDRVAGVFAQDMTINSEVLQNTLNNSSYIFAPGAATSGVSHGPDGILVETLAPGPTGVKGQTIIKGGTIVLSDKVDATGARIYTVAVTPAGVNASAITAGRINTEMVRIYSGDQVRFLWKHDGIFAYDHDVDGVTNTRKFVRYNEEGMLFSENDRRIASFGWDGLYIGAQEGSLELAGATGLTMYNSTDVNTRRRLLHLGKTVGTGLYGLTLFKVVDGVEKPTLFSTNEGDLWLQDTLTVGDGNNLVGISGAAATQVAPNYSATTLYAEGDVVRYGTSFYRYIGSTSELGVSPLITTHWALLLTSAADPIRIWAGAPEVTNHNAPFYVTQSGRLRATQATISGHISAWSGTVGNWVINDAAMNKGALTNIQETVGLGNEEISFWSGGARPPAHYISIKKYEPGNLVFFNEKIYENVATSTGNEPNDPNFWRIYQYEPANFFVRSNGELYANQAFIKGTVYATSGFFSGTIEAKEGYIAGWKILESRLESLDGAVGLSSTELGYMIWAGKEPGMDPLFSVAPTGELKAQRAEIAGNIYADRGYFRGTMSIGIGEQYDPTKDYKFGDIVYVDGYSYQYIFGIETRGNPVYNSAYWQGVMPYSYLSGDPFETYAMKIGNNFYVTREGRVMAVDGDFSGKITAALGEIGGWSIDVTSLQSTNPTTSVGFDSVAERTIWAGPIGSPNFYVDRTGFLYAQNADIVGRITATSGYIADKLDIGPDGYSFIKYIEVGSADPGPALAVPDEELTIKVGRWFGLTPLGKIHAMNADIQGRVTANEGYIGGKYGWVIESQLLRTVDQEVGLFSGDLGYLVEPNDSARIWAGGFNEEDPTLTPFVVTSKGKLFSNNAVVRGHIITETGRVEKQMIVGKLGSSSGIVIDAQGEVPFIGSTSFDNSPIGSGWRINGQGEAWFGDINARGTIRTNIFEYNRISAVGGSLYVAPTLYMRAISMPIAESGAYYTLSINHPYGDLDELGRMEANGLTWQVGDEVFLDFIVPNSANTETGQEELTGIRAAIANLTNNLIAFRFPKNYNTLVESSGVEPYNLTGLQTFSGMAVVFYGRAGRRQALFLTSVRKDGGPSISVYDSFATEPNLLNGTSSDWQTTIVSQYTGAVAPKFSLESKGLVVGEIITFNIYLKSVTKPLRARLTFLLEDGTYVNGNFFGNIIPIGSEGFSSVTVTIPADFVDMTAYISNADTTIVENTIESYKLAKLERGPIASEWSPSSDDDPLVFLPKVRLGNLEGLNDARFGVGHIGGYGLYSQNAFLSGQVMLPGVGITNQMDTVYSPDVEGFDPSPIRIWAGADLSAQQDITAAPFIVTQDGALYASKGIFSGVVRATDGIFSGILRAAGVVIDNDNKANTEEFVPMYKEISGGVIVPNDKTVFGQDFFVAYTKYPTSVDDYVLNISGAGLSIWEGGLRAYSDYLNGWRVVGGVDVKQESAILPYGGSAPFPYLQLIDTDLHPRMSLKDLHVINLAVPAGGSYRYTSIKTQNGKLIFSSGIESTALSYKAIESRAYANTSSQMIGEDVFGTGAAARSYLSIETGTGHGVAINGSGKPTYIAADLSKGSHPSTSLNVDGTITIYGTDEMGVLAFGVTSVAKIQEARNAGNTETIGFNFLV